MVPEWNRDKKLLMKKGKSNLNSLRCPPSAKCTSLKRANRSTAWWRLTRNEYEILIAALFFEFRTSRGGNGFSFFVQKLIKTSFRTVRKIKFKFFEICFKNGTGKSEEFYFWNSLDSRIYCHYYSSPRTFYLINRTFVT